MEMKIRVEEGEGRKRGKKKKSKGATVKKMLDRLSPTEVGLREIAQGILLFGLFGLPLFFGFGKIGSLDFTKQAFLVLLSFLALSFWFISGLTREKIEINLSLLTLVSLLFVLAVSASTVLSAWRWGSFWGWPQEVKENLLTLGSLFLLYFSFSHLFSRKEVFSPLSLFFLGGVLAGGFGLLQIFGQFILPFGFTRNPNFNTLGGTGDLALFSGALIPFSISLFFGARKKVVKLLSGFGFLTFSSILLVVNSQPAWMSLFLAMAAYLTLLLWKAGDRKQRLLLAPALLFCLSVGFGVLNLRSLNLVRTPIEVSPSLRATFETSLEMIKRSPQTWVTGWGPGTFKYGWSQFRSQAVTRTLFWNTRFTRGGSGLVERLGTFGLLGFGLNVLLIGLGLVAGVRAVSRLEKDEEWLLGLGAVTSFLFLSAAKVFSAHNLVLEFAWWLSLGLIAVVASRRKREFRLTAESSASFVFSFLGIILLTGGIFLFYLEGARYLSEIKYAQALTASEEGKTKRLLGRAINLNPQEENFWRSLADYYLLQANQEAGKQAKGKKAKKAKNEKLSQSVANAVSASRRATDINPRNVANWQKRGRVYSQIIGWSDGAFDWAVKSYRKALDREPNNPYLLTELGKAYLTQARLTKDEKEKSALLKKAEGSLRKALTRKRNYAPAAYQMASVFNLQGKTKETIRILEGIKNTNPSVLGYDPMKDTRLAFQLGVLYFNQEEFGKAQRELERAVSLNSKYSNARYFLGLTYDKQGRKNKAISQFEEIKGLNPENKEIQNILSNLREGKPARAKKKTPEELPIQKKPKEQ